MIDTTRDGGITTVTIARRHVRNALDRTTLNVFVDALARAVGDVGTKVLVVRGDGDAFTSGDDLDEASRMSAAEFRGHIEQFQQVTRVLRAAAQPVIAAIDGPAFGGGLELALACDLRIASERAVFACPEPQWGLTLSNASSLLLRRLVGDGWARELVMFGRRLDAREALRLGLITRVVATEALDSAVRDAAAWVIAAAPKAVTLTKRLLNGEDTAILDDILAAETDAAVAGFDTDDARRRLAEFAARKRGS